MLSRLCDAIDGLRDDKRVGLIFIDEYGHRRDYTLSEIYARSQQFAAALSAFGVGEGERTFLRLSTTARCAFILVALHRLNAVPSFDDERGATTIIADRKHRAGVDAQRERYTPDTRYLLVGEECEGWARLDTIALVAKPPPPAPCDEASLEGPREEARSRLGAVSTDIVWYARNVNDPQWAKCALADPWLIQCATVIHDAPFSAVERLDLLRELGVTIVLQAGCEYEAEVEAAASARFKLPRLRRCDVLDGEPSEGTAQRWKEIYGHDLGKTGTMVQ
jgi:hypothetical protein